ncbi:thioredoxin family protein [Pseudalkalibacillus sp. SCS-8]|uniref:thioredoxin family protein n=1 Tax=Pseudalkalibacillus nanhaiensis TaxID=3115291 RepID=UPI0032DB6AEF
MIQETTYSTILQKRFNRKRMIVFFYTPLCGTCKLAKKMLEVALEAGEGSDSREVLACNLNQMPAIARDWEITSVPCVVFIDEGRFIDKVYSIRSVDHIYSKIKEFHQNAKKSSG